MYSNFNVKFAIIFRENLNREIFHVSNDLKTKVMWGNKLVARNLVRDNKEQEIIASIYIERNH